ncbi:hypothetical protein DYST_02679 [Dyella terrae]|nr:hypothetical protein DYST_02679 [Dyella terrae]
MKYVLGYIFGLTFAALGIFLGVYFAWKGLSSEPYSAVELGSFWGYTGCFLGCSCAVIGALTGLWRKSASHRSALF